MKKLAALALICISVVQAAAVQRYNGSVEKLLLGKWGYKSGKYEYYDSANKKLKESEITAIQRFDIEVHPKSAKVIYPDKKEFRSAYSVTKENGKPFVVVILPEKVVKYEILSINKDEITVQARHNVTFYVDGDVSKKVAYGLVIIHLERK